MKITASLNISIREAKQGANIGSKFASVVGLLSDKSKAIEFDVNGDAVSDLEAFAGMCRSKRVAPIVEIECEGLAAEPSMVTEQATGVKRARTWAGKPVYRLTGTATLARVVDTEPLPETKIAETFMSSAAEVLKVG
jgi:hypothetical protein